MPDHPSNLQRPPSPEELRLRDAVRQRLRRQGSGIIDVSLVVRDATAAALASPGQLDHAIRGLALDIVCAVNRVRRERLAALVPGDPATRFTRIAEAAAAPLIEALARDDAELVGLAYRLYLGKAIEVPLEHWWTPQFIARLEEAAPHVAPAQVEWVSTVLHQMISAFPCWSLDRRSLPLREPMRSDSQRFLVRLLVDVMAAELK